MGEYADLAVDTEHDELMEPYSYERLPWWRRILWWALDRLE